MDKTSIINAWIEKLEKQRLVPKTFPLPASFQRYNLFIVSLTLISTVRYTILICLKYNKEYSLLLGDHVYPYGVVISKIVFCAIVSGNFFAISINYLLHKRLKIIIELIDTELFSYKSSEQSSTVLKKKLLKKYLHRTKVIYTFVNISSKCLFFVAFMFMLYTCTVCIFREKTLLSNIVLLFWVLSHSLVISFTLPNILWVVGLWYVLMTHVYLQVEQAIEKANLLSTLESPELQVNLLSFINSYKSFVVRVKQFNKFSKELCFYTRIFCTVLATSLLYGICVTVNTEPLIALLMVCYWITFEVGFLVVLAPSSSVFEENRFLYRLLNELYSRKSSLFSPQLKHQLQIMIKNTGSKNKCPLALINIDDRIFDHQMLVKYLIDAIRMFVFRAKLLKHLQH